MGSSISRAVIGACLLCMGLPLQAKEEIVFATAPTQPEAETRKLYTPLLQHLSEFTGKKFVLKTAKNFVEYSNKMRAGEYDMIFDGPHFVGWRMERMGHVPLARFPGEIRIVVAGHTDSAYQSIEELAGVRVCAFPSPNMLSMAFLQYFPNPVRQPALIRAQGFKGLNSCLREEKGEVAVLRDKLWAKMDQEGLRLVAAPKRGYPERTFSISKEIEAALRSQIAEALVSQSGITAGEVLLKRFKRDKFIKADPKEYAGLGALLNPVWGFQ